MARRSTQRCGLRRQLLALALGLAGLAGMALSQGAAAQGSVAAGQASYDKTCVACHQPGGKGMAGLAPALAGTLAPLMGQEDGRRYVAGVLVHGLSGRIVSQGMTFVGAMPPQAALSDAELAEVANYLARSLNGAKDDVFKAEDFARERGAKTSHKDLRELRQRLLPMKRAGAVLLAALLGAAGPCAAAEADKASEAGVARLARLHYIQYCTGCHLMDGSGAPPRGIPSMRGTLGHFLQVPGGREFIAQVPGVMNSPLNDRQVADLMNWLLPTMADAHTPAAARSPSPPYSADEIARLRKSRPADVLGTRARLVERMPQADTGAGKAPP